MCAQSPKQTFTFRVGVVRIRGSPSNNRARLRSVSTRPGPLVDVGTWICEIKETESLGIGPQPWRQDEFVNGSFPGLDPRAPNFERSYLRQRRTQKCRDWYEGFRRKYAYAVASTPYTHTSSVWKGGDTLPLYLRCDSRGPNWTYIVKKERSHTWERVVYVATLRLALQVRVTQ